MNSSQETIEEASDDEFIAWAKEQSRKSSDNSASQNVNTASRKGNRPYVHPSNGKVDEMSDLAKRVTTNPSLRETILFDK